MIKITKPYLRDLYVKKELSSADIAKESGWSKKSIEYAIEQFGLVEELTGTRQAKTRMEIFNRELSSRLDVKIKELTEETKVLKKRISDNRIRKFLAKIAEAQGHHYYFYWHNDDEVEIENLNKNRKWFGTLGIPDIEVDMIKEIDNMMAEG